MSFDPNWPRWVQASVADHFKVTANTYGYASLVEELEERTTEFVESTNRLEIRINGPFIKNPSHGFWHILVPCNILIFSHMDGTVENVYNGVDIAGVMAQRASEPVSVFKLGSNPQDDGTFLFCLTLTKTKGESLNVHHFGEIDAASRLRQFGVDFDLSAEIYL